MRKEHELAIKNSDTPTNQGFSEKEQEWQEGFKKMAEDPESMNVEYTLAAQSEVVLENGS